MATFYNQATLSYNNKTVTSNIVSGEITEVLSAAKTAVSDAYSPGEVLTYAVSVVNSGSSDIANITISDDLGAYTSDTAALIPLTYVDGSAKLFINGVPQAAPTVTAGDTLEITGITIPAEGNAIIVYQAEANEFASPAAGSAITNTATVTGGGSSVAASATVPVEDEAVLTISKSLTPSEVTGNTRITYGFIIQNTGNEAENSAVITDTFDPVLSDIAVTVDGVTLDASQYTYDTATGEFATAAGAFTVPAATFSQDPISRAYSVAPGTVLVTVSGII